MKATEAVVQKKKKREERGGNWNNESLMPFCAHLQMDDEGFVPVKLFTKFNRVSRLTTDVRLIREVLFLDLHYFFSFHFRDPLSFIFLPLIPTRLHLGLGG